MMLLNPRVGSTVQVWYAKHYCAAMPLHGKTGVVRIAGRAKPRNHGIEIDGTLYCVPCGNCRKWEG